MLTRAALPFRNLRHFGAANLLIVLGVMLGTAVLTGALLLGDSLKGSLANQTLDRLGQIDAALMTDRFFPASLATRLAEMSPGQEVTSAVILRGTVLRRSEDGSKVLSRAGQVQVVAIEPRFWKLFGENREDLPSDAVLINQALADALQIQPRDGLEVRVEKPQRVPAESVLGKRGDDPALVIETSKLAGVLPERGAGRFTLLPRQETPLILYVQLERLKRRLTRDQQLPAGSVNVLLASKSDGQVEQLQAALARAATLEDLGFTLRKNADNTTLVLETGRMLLEPAAVKAVEDTFKGQSKYTLTPVVTYLANRTYRTDQAAANGQPNGPFVPYSAISGLARVNDVTLGEDEVVVNDFVAQDLWPSRDWQAAVGKPIIRIEYFVESEGHRLQEATHDLKLKAVVPIQGLAADRTLTPEFPGMKTSRIADWNPPFPREQWHPEWIRPRDEEFYRQHRATPKLFIHPKTAEKLFAGRFGSYTSLRIGSASGTLNPADEQAIRAELTAALRPADFGLTWQPVKAQGLQAATQGGTANMFGGLFAGFSLFLIVSAALLVGLLFRLRVERRAREIGLLLATGWPVARTRRLLLTEGSVLALAGALLGLPAAVAYAWLMIQGLRAGWGGMLASDSLSLHVGLLSLAAGAGASVIIALLAILWSLRGLVRQPVPVLLAGRTAAYSVPTLSRRSWARWLPLATALMTLGLIGYGITLPAAQKPGPFFGAGFLCLLTLILAVRLLLRRRAERGQTLVRHPTLGQFGLLDTARSPGRSLLTLTLLAAGCFMVVAVGAFRKAGVDVSDPKSGTGGFDLLAETDVPLRSVLRSMAEWEALLGELTPEQRGQLQTVGGLTWYGFRLRSGEDVSCLNLYQPTRPRILGVTKEFGHLNRFDILLWDRATDAQKATPWSALFDTPSTNAFPVFLDDHTAQWVLQKKLGDAIELLDEAGTSHEGMLVGMVQGSIFQSEMLIAEGHFRRLFPGEAGYRYFLVNTAHTIEIRPVLESLLGDSHGMVVRSTAEKLASFHAVENTYIGTFQALGGLGLLLGTAGLAIVILRNVQERKSELALLQAVGFSRRQVAATLLIEVAWLIGAGVVIGCLSALIVVAPLLTSDTIRQLLTWLILILVVVPVIGWLASLAGIRLALRSPLIPALRGD